MQLIELSSISEMISQFEIITHLYPNMTKEKYQNFLQEMLPHNYKQLGVFDNDNCLALTGFWTGVKLWTGKYIEIDNFIVHPEHRQSGLGKLMTDYLTQKAIEQNCSYIVLDAFTSNFKAHKFYFNQGFEPLGFHFVKKIN